MIEYNVFQERLVLPIPTRELGRRWGLGRKAMKVLGIKRTPQEIPATSDQDILNVWGEI